MKPVDIEYRFTMGNGKKEVFTFALDPERGEILGLETGKMPSWTRLEYFQCANCPLKPDTTPQCPLAVNLVDLVRRFDGLASYDRVDVHVIMNERTVSQNTTVQRGIGSLMGLLIAGSRCPHTAFLKPMARFHLPLASREETILRATSIYLLAQYFRKQAGQTPDMEFEGLMDLYQNMQTVNAFTARRLRGATETDSSVNALLVLDIYAKTMEVVIQDSLEQIRYVFGPSEGASKPMRPPSP